MNDDNKVALTPDVYANLKAVALDLGISIDELVLNLAQEFLASEPLGKGGTQNGEKSGAERRAHPRVKINRSAMLYFKSEDSRYGFYKPAQLRDMAPGGVLVELDAPQQEQRFFIPGNQFELIFQVKDEDEPVHILCQICRVDNTSQEKTKLGVAFKNN